MNNDKNYEVEDLKKDNITILCTGSHGHIGSYVIEWLCKVCTNSTIICVDNRYNSNFDNLTESREWARKNKNRLLFDSNHLSVDITNQYALEDIFSWFLPEYVCHQASMLTLDTKKFRLDGIRTNIMGFANIIELCKKYSTKKFVFASSASVYGNPKEVPVSETHDFNNTTLLYGATKIANEYLARSYADEEGLKILGLRPFNVYGYRQSMKNVYIQIVPEFIQSILNNKIHEAHDDGQTTLDLIHGKDAGYFYVKALFDDSLYRIKDEFDGFINLGTGVSTSVIQLYHLIREAISNHDIDVSKSDLKVKESVEDFHDIHHVRRRQADVTLLNEKLGRHKIEVPEGIQDTVEQILKKKKVI